MLWKVKYVIDDGYAHHRCVCVIKANTKEDVRNILHTEVECKLKGDRIIRDNYTEIEECDNEPVIYNSWKIVP